MTEIPPEEVAALRLLARDYLAGRRLAVGMWKFLAAIGGTISGGMGIYYLLRWGVELPNARGGG